MSTERKVGLVGLIASYGGAAYFGLDAIAKVFGIMNIPKDARENLSFAQEHSSLLALLLLVVGSACAAYLLKDGVVLTLRWLRSPKMESVIVICIGLATVLLGVVHYARSTAVPASQVQKPVVYTIPPETRDGITWSAMHVGYGTNFNGHVAHIVAAAISGKNVSENFIELKRARVISSTTSEQFDMLVASVGPPAPVAEINPIPPGAEFVLTTNFGLADGGIDVRPTLDEFIKRFGVFRFLVEYGTGSTLSKEVTPTMLRQEIARTIESWPEIMRQPEPKPQVTRRRAPDQRAP